jgi:hypothetical protein
MEPREVLYCLEHLRRRPEENWNDLLCFMES